MNSIVTIGLIARERFALAGESLASLYEHTAIPFELVVVDAATPQHYWDPVQAVLDQHDNWRVLQSPRHLLPAQAKNLIVREANTDYLCLLENDNLFTDGWLEALIDACETFPADVASPVIREGRGETGHFDQHLGTLVASGDQWAVEPLPHPRNNTQQRCRVEFVEQHCLLFRRSVFDQIGPFDEELNTRDEVDLSLALRHAGATVVLVPDAILNYVPPTSAPEPDELPFFRMRWDLRRAEMSRERIRERWNLVDTPGDLEFVRYRNRIVELPTVRSRLSDACRDGTKVVVLEDGDWFDTDVTSGLPVTPFPNSDGHFGGFPQSEEWALVELARVLDAGTTTLVVGWPARWWFDHLPKLRAALEAWATTVESDELLDVYSR